MKNNIKLLIIGMSTMFCVACASNDENDAYRDLQKLANAITSLGLPSQNEVNASQKPGLNIYQADRLPSSAVDNVVEEEFSDDYGTHSYRSEFFDIDGVTPLTEQDARSQGNYVEKVNTQYRNDQYESNFYLVNTHKITGDDIFLGVNMEISGNGVVDYYNDDLVLVADSVFAKFDFSEGITLRYEMSFMEEKYHFVLEKTFTMEDMLVEQSDDVVEESISGNIIDVDGDIVGKFILNSDESVVIKDKNGNTIQSAGS